MINSRRWWWQRVMWLASRRIIHCLEPWWQLSRRTWNRFWAGGWWSSAVGGLLIRHAPRCVGTRLWEICPRSLQPLLQNADNDRNMHKQPKLSNFRRECCCHIANTMKSQITPNLVIITRKPTPCCSPSISTIFGSGFPYAPLKAMLTKISMWSRIQDSLGITPKIESLVVFAIPDIPRKFQKDPSTTFWVILLTHTDKQSLAKT